MMEMDGLDSVKWQKSKGRDINGILGKFNEEDDKIENSGHLPPSKRRQIGWNLWGRCRNEFWEIFREREREHFSLDYRAIRPSAVFGARRKNVLCGAGYAWTPGLGVCSNSLR